MAKFFLSSKISENIGETPEGYLLCKSVPIARTGWQEYGEGETPLETGDDGMVHVYRDEKEVFDPKTMASFEGKALTIKHPAEFVGPDNWQYLSKGSLHNIRKAKEADDDGEWSMLADILVTEARAIQLVKNGLREVSCGYEAEYEQTEDGKGRQVNIIGNHLALVEQGRAGSSYAINDEKGKVTMSAKLIDKLKKKFGAQVVDEAMKDEKESEATDKGMMDELVKTVKDLQTASQRIEGMLDIGKAKDKKAADEKEEKAKDSDKEEKSEDADEAGSKLEERLTALEAAVAKLLEKTGDEESDESEDEDSEESEDEDEMSEDDMDESEDEEYGEEKKAKDSDEGEEGEQSQKKSGKTGDAAMIEILAPGFKPAKGKDGKVEALKRAYATKDGKKVIDSLTGLGKPDYRDAKQVEVLFKAASQILKAKRGNGLDGTRSGFKAEVGDSASEPMTAEKLNELNAKHYAGEKERS